MRTTVSLEADAYRLAQALAAQQNTTLGKVLGDALLKQFSEPTRSEPYYSKDAEGFPVIYIGRPITPQDVAEAIAED